MSVQFLPFPKDMFARFMTEGNEQNSCEFPRELKGEYLGGITTWVNQKPQKSNFGDSRLLQRALPLVQPIYSPFGHTSITYFSGPHAWAI
jgi:hypothetical protein